jgi:hypothetical protein
MKIKTAFLVGFCIYSNFISGQSKPTKQFSGNFDNGTATYSYYENENYERMYHGAFTFNSNVKKYDGLKVNISGNFSDNLRDGNWSFNVKNYKSPISELLSEKDKAMGQMALQLAYQLGTSNEKIAELKNALKNKVVFNTYSSSLKGNYVSGKLEGNWIFSESSTGASSPIMGYTNYKSNIPTYSSVNFSNNRLVGRFLYKQGEKYLIDGQFDENGKLTGKWIIRWVMKNEAFENIREYENGELKTMVERNTSSGDILFRDSNSDGAGRKIMINAIFFWLTSDETLTVDDVPVSERNYMFKFDRGMIKPTTPFE